MAFGARFSWLSDAWGLIRGAGEVVVAFSTQTGRAQWSFEYSAKFEEYFGGIGPRSTPAWDEGRLYSLGAKGHLHCLDANTGKQK